MGGRAAKEPHAFKESMRPFRPCPTKGPRAASLLQGGLGGSERALQAFNKVPMSFPSGGKWQGPVILPPPNFFVLLELTLIGEPASDGRVMGSYSWPA